MELSYKTYRDNEERIMNEIEECDFISFDLEMTGIDSDINNSLIDTPEIRYLKYKTTAEKYKIIQLGLTLFKFNSRNNYYEVSPYSFYLFPCNSLNNDSIISCELKSLLFNKKNGIDFNEWIKNGICYLNDRQYKELYRKIIDDNVNLIHEEVYINKNLDDYWECENIIEDVKKNFFPNLNVCSNYMIKNIPNFMIHYIKNKLNDNLYFERKTLQKGGTFVFITKYKNENEKNELIKKDIEQKLMKLEQKKGVKHLFDKIIKNKKVLIGHNISLDILFFINSFGKPLPKKYNDFKEYISNNFELYDTKLIFESLKEKSIILKDVNSILDKMYPILKSMSENLYNYKIINSKTDFEVNNTYHNAGYDSFITGLCFLSLKYLYSSVRFKDNFKNKVYIMKSLYTNFDFLNDEIMIEQNTINYCLKAVKRTGDIQINNIVKNTKFEKSIRRVLNCEKFNTLIVMVNKDDLINNMVEFENILRKKENMKYYSFYTLEEFRNKYMK
jgi:poly(A)-specific ribonuclease